MVGTKLINKAPGSLGKCEKLAFRTSRDRAAHVGDPSTSDVWVGQRRNNRLREVALHLGSTVRFCQSGERPTDSFPALGVTPSRCRVSAYENDTGLKATPILVREQMPKVGASHARLVS